MSWRICLVEAMNVQQTLIIAKKVGGFKKSARERQLAILEQYHLSALKERFAY